MIFTGDPLDLEAVSEKFAHKLLDPDVDDGIQVFPVEDTEEGLVIRYDGKVGTGQV